MKLAEVQEYLNQCHIRAKESWLENAIKFVTGRESNLTLNSLCSRVLELFLHSDLAESYQPVLKIPPNAAKMMIVKTMIFQVAEVIDVARPVYEQFCELNEESNDLSWFHGDDGHESEAVVQERSKFTRRMLKFTLVDGVNKIFGLEFGTLTTINESVKPGSKILLTSRALYRRGIILLNDNNCQLLGGDVESLCKSFDKHAQLAGKLGIPVNQGKRKSAVKAPTLPPPPPPSTASGVATISPFLIRIPRSDTSLDLTTDTDSSVDKRTKKVVPPRPYHNTEIENECNVSSEPSSRSLIVSSLCSPGRPDSGVESSAMDTTDDFVPNPKKINLDEALDKVRQTVQRTQISNQKTRTNKEIYIVNEVRPNVKTKQASNHQENNNTSNDTLEKATCFVVPAYEVSKLKKNDENEKERKMLVQGNSRQPEVQVIPNNRLPEYFPPTRRKESAGNKTIRSDDSFLHCAPPLSQLDCGNDADVEGNTTSTTGSPERAPRKDLRQQQVRRQQPVQSAACRNLFPGAKKSVETETRVAIRQTSNQHISPEEQFMEDYHKEGDLVLSDKFFSPQPNGMFSKPYSFPAFDDQLMEEVSTSATKTRKSGQLVSSGHVNEQMPMERGLTISEIQEKLAKERCQIQSPITSKPPPNLSFTPPLSTDIPPHLIRSNSSREKRHITSRERPEQNNFNNVLVHVSDMQIPEKRRRLEEAAYGEMNEEFNSSGEKGNLSLTTLFPEVAVSTKADNRIETVVQDDIVSKYRTLNLVTLADVAAKKVYWMLPKTVLIQAVCNVPNDLKTKDNQWILPVSISDVSMDRVYCDMSSLLLEKLLGFTVASCREPQVTRNKLEMARRKQRAQSLAKSLLRLDLIFSIEMYPERSSTPLILDVKTIAEMLHLDS